MKNALGFFLLLSLLTQTCSLVAFSQDYGQEVVDSLIKSSEWLEKAWNKSFELKISRRSSGTFEVKSESKQSAPDLLTDLVNHVFILRDSPEDEWFLSHAVSWSRLYVDRNQDTRNEHFNNAVYAKAIEDDKILLFRLRHERPEEFRGKAKQLIDRLLSVEVDQIAITILSMERKPGIDFLDYLVDFCLDPSNKSRIHKEEELVDGVNRLVYRITMIHSAGRVYGIRFVVSANGFDRGLITEVHYRLIKKDELKASYVSEDQLQTLPKIYVKTDWQEFIVDEARQDTIVVPRRISKREDSNQAIKAAEISKDEFDWKPLSEESKQKINLEEAKKKAEELAKDIDKILNR
jgi:hypothetical protein